ncbi:uncharacterized protein LOC105249208 isoform X2 [Camponotus floridanus]|nr:uncharacterized protein LOC105249208 isoform X2 [Camponotus floridanus]
MPWCAFIIQYSQANAASLEKEDPSGIYHNIIIIRQQDLLPLSFPKIPSIMDEKPRNFRAFKRALNRKVEREIAKRTKLERIASVLYKRYGKSESNNESENESEHIVNQCYIINANHDKNNDVTGDNNINVFNCNNDEDDHNESDNLENNELLRHDASNSELSIENFSDNENSRVHDTESTHTCTESDVEGIGVQELVSSDETDIEEEQIHCLHINEIGQYVAIKIKEWACEEGMLSMRKLQSLLLKLHPVFPNLCLTYKTLLNTVRNIQLIQIDDGEIWYKGIIFNLDSMNLNDYLERFNKIVIDINIDGLPISKSSSSKFWPILGRLVWSKNEPFIISIYKGNKDPNIQDFLHSFVREIEYLQENGYIRNGIRYTFSIRHYILDAPARAKIKCCKDHVGYCACEKCEVIGEYIDNRMTFVELNEPLRTDESYNNQKQPYHHTGHSPLEKIGTGLVSQFRLDGMHLIFLGVIKRLLLTWKMCNGPWKLHRNTIAAISSELISLKPSCPQDFNRPPRSLAEISFYKATEFRRFLLYDGILVLRDYLDENIYKHFLLLHCGIYILSSPVLVKSHCKYAGQLLRTFIKHSVVIYGARFVVYNVHSMCHLEEECQQHGHLENFSAFVFENKLQGRELTQEDDEFYDVGRTEWITDIDENMEAKIKWPPCNAGKFVQKELPASPDWIEERIIIRKFYDARINAIISCKGIIDDSNYETDKEFGKGMRKKKKNCFFDSSESEKESDNNKCPVKSKTIEKNNKKQFKKYTNVSKNIKKIAPPPSISASFCKSTCMLSPERQSKTRQHIKQPKLPLNIKISESSKQSHTDTINVLRNIREKNKESDKRTQLFERLKKHGHEKLHKYEEKAALSSMQETLQEQNIYEIQEAIILSPLKEKETPQKNDRSLRSPLQMLSPNCCNNSNKSYCHLFKTPEKNNNSSPLKSSETESYTAYHLSPSLLQPVTRKGNERKNNNSSPLKSSGTESYTAHHLSPSLLQPVTRKGNERKNNNSSPLKSSGTESYTAHHLSPSLLQPVTRKGNEKDSSLQTMLANCIYKLDENMKITKQINSKMDIFIMNQEKLHRYLLPGEKVVKRPSGLPSFPVETEHELNQMEEFLKDDNNLSAATFYFAKFIDPKSIENSVRKLLSKILSNSVANNYNFHGTRGKQRFKDLKIWELVQG